MKTPSMHHVLGRLILIFPLLLKISIAGYHYFDHHKRRLLAIWLFLFLAGGWFQAMAFYSYAEAAEPSGRGTSREEILILNSYHPGNAWSDAEQAGIIDVFRGKDKNWLPVVEYLDLLRLPDGRHLAELKQLFRRKYQNRKFSVVIAMDNPVLEFAIDNQSELFGNAPIVFCGINNYRPSMLKGHTNVTGIAETLDQAGTIELMLRLHPKSREILLIHDYTVTGLEARREIEALAPRFAAQVRFRFLDRLSMDEVLKKLEGLPKDSLVLLRLFITDKTGHTFGLAEATQLITKHSPVPVYSTHESRLGFGIVGGKLLSARIHGANAARIALRVLAGEKAAALSVVLESDSQFMFDYKVMSRFGIPLSALPEGSTVINKPVSFYATHRAVIQTALVIVVILVIVISALTVIIIQRRRSAIALRASEAKYYDLYENAPDMFLSVDTKTATIIECNNTLVHTIGYAKEEIVGRSIFEIYHPDCKEDVKRLFQQFATTGEVRNAELKIMRKDGSIIDISLNASAVKDNKGKIIHSRSIWRDITERKRLEEILKKEQQELKLIIDSSPIIIFYKDKEGKFIRVNKTFAEAIKLPEEEVCGKTVFDLYSAKIAQGMTNDDQEVLKSGRPKINIIEQYESASGIRWVQTDKIPIFDKNGIPFGLIGFAQDITERKRAEEALKKSESMLKETQQITKVGGWEYDIENKKLTWTDEVYRIHELSSDYDPNNIQNDIEFYAPDARKIIEAAFYNAVEKGEPYDLMLPFTTAKGTQLWVRTVGKADFREGKPIRVYGNIMDVTEAKKAEEELSRYREHLEELVKKRTVDLMQTQDALANLVDDLNEKTNKLVLANERLKELDRLKSMFIASMSHELRTPLNSIIGFTGIILQGIVGEITEEQRKQLKMVQNSARHLLALINDIIDLSKIEAGKVELSFKELDLSALMQEMVNTALPALSEKGLEVFLEVPGRLVAKSDERRVKQVLMNLLSNGVKFTDQGFVRITAQVTRDEGRQTRDEGSSVVLANGESDRLSSIVISVEDTGIGIKEEDMDKLFKVFSRISTEGRARQEGTGLGLYLSKKIADLLGGEIGVKSEFGKGSTFIFVLPLGEDEAR